eukprot:4646297-Pyramimonas_sp.AAC.1
MLSVSGILGGPRRHGQIRFEVQDRARLRRGRGWTIFTGGGREGGEAEGDEGCEHGLWQGRRQGQVSRRVPA